MSDIVERLHKCDLTLHDLIICDEAADTIEALRAENARLREDAERYQFIRRRLELKNHQVVSGKTRLGLNVRIGLSFLDTPNRRGASNQTMRALDDAIDAALATKEQS